MTTLIIPEIRQINRKRIMGISPELERELAYAYALNAMPLLDDRIKFSGFTTTTGQPIQNLREWLRAVEAGEWPQ